MHDQRLADALAPLRIPRWPTAGVALVRECGNDGRTDVHLFRDWCWLGTARADGALATLSDAPQSAVFDPDVVKLLVRRHRNGTLRLIDVPAATPARQEIEYA